MVTRRLRWAVVGLVLLAAAGCVGQISRNDDQVGPYSYRPDARDHRIHPGEGHGILVPRADDD